MADVTGPISSLPGSTAHALPKDATCDDHPDRPAAVRVQGETDSFGCEMIDMCDECYAAYREEIKNADTSGTCDWCKNFAEKLSNRRDYEEGTSGRVYQVCDACIKRENEQLAQEEDGRDDYGYDDAYDYDPQDYRDDFDDVSVEEQRSRSQSSNGDADYAAYREHQRKRLLADWRPEYPAWEITMTARFGRTLREIVYYVRARDAIHAKQRAVAMLPKHAHYEEDAPHSARVFVPRDAKHLRQEREREKQQKFAASLPPRLGMRP